jgi:hypothetical protein
MMLLSLFVSRPFLTVHLSLYSAAAASVCSDLATAFQAYLAAKSPSVSFTDFLRRIAVVLLSKLFATPESSETVPEAARTASTPGLRPWRQLAAIDIGLLARDALLDTQSRLGQAASGMDEPEDVRAVLAASLRRHAVWLNPYGNTPLLRSDEHVRQQIVLVAVRYVDRAG